MPKTSRLQPKIQRASHEPLYLQIANQIAAQISAGALVPGGQVPSETVLMAMHGVSRITVRQALALLARNGQVVAKRGKGTFVARPAVHHDLDALRGFQDGLIRQGVEAHTELLEFSPAAGRTDRTLPAGLNLPVRLRRLYRVDDAPFAIVEAFLPAEAATLGVARARRLMVYEIVRQFLELRIARADMVIRCAQPGVELGRLLGLAPRTPVLVMERTSIGSNGTPCEFTRIHIAPERYAFRLSLPGPIEMASALHAVLPASTAATPSRDAGAPPARPPRAPRARSRR
jgi:GntR family transcriptional regulator